MEKMNEEMKQFFAEYIKLMKENIKEQKELDALNKEIEAIYKADREEAEAYAIGVFRASGVKPELGPVKDPRYAVKTRQKEKREEALAKKIEERNRMLIQKRSEIETTRKDKEAEMKMLSTENLAKAEAFLAREEEKKELGGSEEQMKLFEEDIEIARNAVKMIEEKIDKLCMQIDEMRAFENNIKMVADGSISMSDLEKEVGKVKPKTSPEPKSGEPVKPKTSPEPKSGEPVKPGTSPEPKSGEPVKPGTSPEPKSGEPVKPETSPEPKSGEPVKPETSPEPKSGEPVKPGTSPEPKSGEPVKPEASSEPSKPEGNIKAIRYNVGANLYEFTFENGAKTIVKPDNSALREFKKEDKRYLKELIPGFGAYKKCDIGLFKALRSFDQTNGTKQFEEYIKLLNGEDSTLEQIMYDAERMNDPQAFQNQESEARRVMTRMMRKVRNVEGIEVNGYRPTRWQRIADFFTGGKRERIEEPKQPKLVEEAGEIVTPKVEEHPILTEEKGEIVTPEVVEHPITSEEAKEVEKAFKGRRSQKGREWAKSLHVDETPEPEKKEYTVDEILEEIKRWDKEAEK